MRNEDIRQIFREELANCGLGGHIFWGSEQNEEIVSTSPIALHLSDADYKLLSWALWYAATSTLTCEKFTPHKEQAAQICELLQKITRQVGQADDSGIG